MAKQFSILATDEDLRFLELVLRNLGGIEFRSDEATMDLNDLFSLQSLSISPSDAGRISLFCYLLPTDFEKKIFIEKISSVKIRIDQERSNLIEFWRPFYNGKIIRPGRFYYHDREFLNEIYQPKDAKFCDWAKKVFSCLKKNLHHDAKTGIYFGENARKHIASGAVKVVSVL